ncbi:Glycosyl transferase family 2 [Candidatus Nitrotoga sp. HW29]|uniref:glycosyltransferase family 2 protein n=1 Tax=Candidatus Nitrotoga sp. HW29 TaxID=2886963 RepID=UPI001EF1E668|nr:glycosyltransferase family 2 protein [Candidatus Nitrotoga sp. HW29]CAH1904847.1 Glycosyl transferase family 2 [Candidatus Nitrotoga sp. HW29]
MLNKISCQKELNLEIIMVGFAANIKKILRPGVGQLGTYSPRPVSFHRLKQNNLLHEQTLPKISIVVPSLNQDKFIEATLQSIINQQYANLELIVIDGGSTDNTLSIIKQYEAHITWWVSEPDSGQTEAINKGFMQSTGEIMAWINSDDLAAPRAIHQVADYFVKHPETQVVYGNRILINEDSLEIGRWILPRHSNRVLKWADFVPQETLYWTRKAWNLIGARLDESFHFAMDWDFLLRLSAKQIDIHHLPIFLGLFRIHDQQKTSNKMLSIGQQEIQMIRHRELGFQPSRWQLILSTMPFLLAAKFLELRFKLGLNRKTNA